MPNSILPAAQNLLQASNLGLSRTLFSLLPMQQTTLHLIIRYRGGKFGGPLQPGIMEIVTDNWFPAMFIKAGKWTFKIEAIIPGKGKEEKDRYLFAFQMSQWLEGTAR